MDETEELTKSEEPNFGHFYKISDKSQNIHTADLGYLGFQDDHKKFSAL